MTIKYLTKLTLPESSGYYVSYDSMIESCDSSDKCVEDSKLSSVSNMIRDFSASPIHGNEYYTAATNIIKRETDSLDMTAVFFSISDIKYRYIGQQCCNELVTDGKTDIVFPPNINNIQCIKTTLSSVFFNDFSDFECMMNAVVLKYPEHLLLFFNLDGTKVHSGQTPQPHDIRKA